jgi:hypothetical protein
MPRKLSELPQRLVKELVRTRDVARGICCGGGWGCAELGARGAGETERTQREDTDPLRVRWRLGTPRWAGSGARLDKDKRRPVEGGNGYSAAPPTLPMLEWGEWDIRPPELEGVRGRPGARAEAEEGRWMESRKDGRPIEDKDARGKSAVG